MKKHLMVSLIGIGLFLAVCSPTTVPVPSVTATPMETLAATPSISLTPTITAVPTSTSVSTNTPTVTPTPRPQATLKQDATLYLGPGAEGYKTLAQLKAGTIVYPQGIYEDFVKAQMEVGGKKLEGFIWKELLAGMPQGLKRLESNDVPWQPLLALTDIRFENNSDEYSDVDGDAIPLTSPFVLTLKMSVNQGGSGSLKVYGIYKSLGKEWWQDILRMDVVFLRNSVQLAFRDGTQDSPKTTITVPANVNQPITLFFKDPQGKVFTVLDQDQRELRTIDLTAISGLQMKEGLFPERKLYPGFSRGPRSRLTIATLAINQVPLGKMIAVAQLLPGLSELAWQKGLDFGAGISIWRMWNIGYRDIINKQFRTATIYTFSCPERFWRSRQDYDFSVLDSVVDTAIQQGFRVRASHLLWGTYACSRPDWLLKGQFSRDEYVKILEEHVKTVVNHFKGRVSEWSVVNEAIQRSFCQKNCDFWAEKIGPEYIEMAFRWAREIDPSAILIFNETNNHSLRDSASRDTVIKMLDTVRALKAKGVPIDAVGMHMHMLSPWYKEKTPKKEEVIETMNLIAALGVDIYVTEFDVNIQEATGSQQERLEYQAQIYRDMMDACLEVKACKSFHMGAISDLESYYATVTNPLEGPRLPNADPHMFDKDFRPKPAYYAVRDALIRISNPTPVPKP